MEKARSAVLPRRTGAERITPYGRQEIPGDIYQSWRGNRPNNAEETEEILRTWMW